MQKSFHQILQEQLGEYEENTTIPSQEGVDERILRSWQTLQDFAVKNIKTHIIQTSYKVHLVNQEQKKAQALQQKYQALYNLVTSVELKKAVQFFFKRGAVHFLDQKPISLKKDFRALAKKLHPDLARESKNVESEFCELKASYDLLNKHFTSEKAA